VFSIYVGIICGSIYFVVLCCAGTSYCVECKNKYCKRDVEFCETQEAAKWLTAMILSLIPIPGICSLYIGEKYDAAFELLHGVFTLILCKAHDEGLRSSHTEDTGLGVCMICIINHDCGFYKDSR